MTSLGHSRMTSKLIPLLPKPSFSFLESRCLPALKKRSALKALDVCKIQGINVKTYLKSAKEPIQALYQGKQFKIHDLRTMLTCLSQNTYGIDPTFTNKCVDYVEFLREMDHKHQFSAFEDAIKALKAHIPPLDFKSIFTELENQYILCKKDKMWSPDKLVLPDPAAVPSSFLSSSVPVTTGGIDQAKTDLFKALLAAMKKDNQECYKCGAKDHFANSPKCPKNKFKSCRNNRAKFQRSPSAPSASTSTNPSHSGQTHSSQTSWKKVSQREGAPLIKQHNGRSFYWCSTWELSSHCEAHF